MMMQRPRMQKYCCEVNSFLKSTARLSMAILLGSFIVVGLGSCGNSGHNGDGLFNPNASSTPPYIYAELVSFPPGQESSGFQSAVVYVIDN